MTSMKRGVSFGMAIDVRHGAYLQIALADGRNIVARRRKARPYFPRPKPFLRADTRTICGVSRRWEATPSSTALASAS